MDDYAGRVLAGRYRLSRPSADEFEPLETRGFDTYSGQEVLVRQLLLPEVVHAEADDDDPWAPQDTRLDESAHRALEAARAAAAIPDHPRLVQVFDVLIEDRSLWVVSELVPAAVPVALLLEQAPFSPYRAAEVAADVLAGLRVLHGHGWAHRNVTAETVLLCEDGRAMLDGLVFGAAQEALCGYDPVPQTASGPDAPAENGSWGGPDSALAMERARQARITVVGPVTERWAPEQAVGPAPGNWQLAPPVGPAVDLWALGALMFRCVQGRAAFPEEHPAELVQLVCAEPPAPAEECGPLRPVVESLLRQDPAERPGAEELRGWLHSLVRSAPEPDIGLRTVQVPTGPADAHRLPIVRRRGEVVRQRKRREKAGRAAAAVAAAEPQPAAGHGRHARARIDPPPASPGRPPASLDAIGLGGSRDPRDVRDTREPYAGADPGSGGRRGPRRLGLLLLVAILVALAGLVAYAMHLGPRHDDGADRSLPAQVSSGHSHGGTPAPATDGGASAPASASATPAAPPPAVALDPGFSLRRDPAGFTVAVHDGWSRSAGAHRATVFTSGGAAFRLTVVAGRDPASSYGSDPIGYESDKEPELAAFRASSWTSVGGLKRLQVNGSPAAEGEFNWRDPHSGREMFGSNLVVLRGGRYDVVLLTGPANQRQTITTYFGQSAETFRAGG